jgi:hypothetical protein
MPDHVKELFQNYEWALKESGHNQQGCQASEQSPELVKTGKGLGGRERQARAPASQRQKVK